MNNIEYSFELSGTKGKMKKLKFEIKKYCTLANIKYNIIENNGFLFCTHAYSLQGNKYHIDDLVSQIKERCR